MALIKQESEEIKIVEAFSVKHQETEQQTGAKPGTEQIHKSRGQTSKDCYLCRKKIGVASKTCQHCRAKQPYKQKLEKKKNQLSQEWIDRQKKNSSVNKVYDATNLLLHKWALLERFPVLLLARRSSSGFSAECFCPWKTDTEDTHGAFLTIQRLYESLLNVVNTDKSMMGKRSQATHSTQTQTETESASLLTCKEASIMENSTQTGTQASSSSSSSESHTASSSSSSPSSSSLAPPPVVISSPSSSSLTPSSSSLTPSSSSLAPPPVVISSPSSSSLTPSSSSLAPPPVVISSPSSSSLTPSSSSLAPPLSACVKRSTKGPGPVSSSREKRPIKRKADPNECPMRKDSPGFPYKHILRKRIREGHEEVLVQRRPCSGRCVLSEVHWTGENY